jgi:ATP-binding cassette, subfamily B, bacterial
MPSPQDQTLGPEVSNWKLVRRLLAFSWTYRRGCLKVLGLQLALLTLGVAGLGFTGLALDIIRNHVAPGAIPPRWPLGWLPPAAWTAFTQVGAIAGLILVFAGLRAWLNYTYSMAVAKLVQGEIVVAMRARVYDKLQRLSFRFFDANASGSIINRVTGDVQNLRMFVDGVLIQSVIMMLSLAVYLTYMASLHVKLTLACLATTPLLWIASVTFSRKVRPAYVLNRELMDRMVLTLTESVQGMQVVKGFGREAEERGKFDAANLRVQEQQRGIFWKISLYSPTVGALAQTNLIILLGYGGYLVIQGQLALGAGLVVFAGLLQQFSAQVSNLATIANSVQQSLTGARRVFEVLDAPVEVQSKPDAIRVERLRGEVTFENVEFAYKDVDPVLRGISFAARPGMRVAIVGATGAGKSALMSLIPRFYDVTGGRLLIDGIDARDLHLDDLRRNIGVVFQESFLFSNTVASNIAFGHPNASRERIERAAQLACADEFIRQLPDGYDTVLGELGLNLSGGQRQRLAIARAVLLEPPILLLDDPTAAIDPETEHEILAAMERAMAGRTTFIVAHRLSTLRRADLIITLDQGRIAQIGSHEELINAAGLYQQLARLQIVDDVNERARLAAREGGAA